MKKIFTAFILAIMLTSTAWANLVYTTSNGKLGIINTQNVKSILSPVVQYSNLGSHTFAVSYWNGNESRLMAIKRTTDKKTSGDTVIVFKSANLSEPIKASSDVLTGVYNTQSVVNTYNGRGLLLASRENASIMELSTSDFSYMKSYVYDDYNEDMTTPHTQGVLVNYSSIYGLFDIGKGNSVLMRFDGQLREHVEGSFKVSFDQETQCVSWLSGSRVAVGTSEGVGVVGKNGFDMLVTTDQPVKAVCNDKSSGFYFITQEESGDKYVSTLYHYTNDQITTLTEGEIGADCTLASLNSNTTLAAIIGEKILIYDTSNDSLLKEFDSDALGGVPVSLAYRYTSGEKSDSSSGNCNISYAGIILLLTFAALKTRHIK